MFGQLKLDVNIEEFKKLNYNRATITKEFLNKYGIAGHNLSNITIWNYFEPNPMPDVVNQIKKHFDYDVCSVAVNLTKPGDYLPLHSDRYNRWMKVFDVDNVNKICRHIVMLQDCVPGQMMQIRENIFTNWTCGSYYGWQGTDPHAIYNFSTEDRYAIQITGIRY